MLLPQFLAFASLSLPAPAAPASELPPLPPLSAAEPNARASGVPGHAPVPNPLLSVVPLDGCDGFFILDRPAKCLDLRSRAYDERAREAAAHLTTVLNAWGRMREEPDAPIDPVSRPGARSVVDSPAPPVSADPSFGDDRAPRPDGYVSGVSEAPSFEKGTLAGADARSTPRRKSYVLTPDGTEVLIEDSADAERTLLAANETHNVAEASISAQAAQGEAKATAARSGESCRIMAAGPESAVEAADVPSLDSDQSAAGAEDSASAREAHDESDEWVRRLAQSHTCLALNAAEVPVEAEPDVAPAPQVTDEARAAVEARFASTEDGAMARGATQAGSPSVARQMSDGVDDSPAIAAHEDSATQAASRQGHHEQSDDAVHGDFHPVSVVSAVETTASAAGVESCTRCGADMTHARIEEADRAHEPKVADKQIADKQIADRRIADKKIADKKVADKKVADDAAGGETPGAREAQRIAEAAIPLEDSRPPLRASPKKKRIALDIDLDAIAVPAPITVTSQAEKVLQTLAQVRSEALAVPERTVHEPDVVVVSNEQRVLMALESLGKNTTAQEDPAQNESPLGTGWTVVDAGQLDKVRGGFVTPTGLQISFGIERFVYVNGQMVTTTTLNVSDLARVSGGSARVATLLAEPLARIQSGAGQLLVSGATPSGLGTVIQNSLNGQKLQTLTVVNATVNSLEVLRGMQLQGAVRSAVTDALRR